MKDRRFLLNLGPGKGWNACPDYAKRPGGLLGKRLPSRNRAPRYLWDKHSRLSFWLKQAAMPVVQFMP
jgi:hypothetical protein